MAFDISTVAGQGTENLETGSAMPFIRILQDLSPQLKKQKDEYVEGAESGDLFFAKTKDLLPKPVEIIPCYTQSVYTEWVPRSKGGGFVATHPLTITSNPSYERGRERKLVSDINRFRYEDAKVNPPLFAQKWTLDTVLETSKNGDDYYNFSFSNNTTLDFEADENLLSMAAESYADAVDTPLLQTEATPQLVDSQGSSDPF